MTQTTQAAAAWLNLILNAVAIANLADNAASSPKTNLYISLHTASPGLTGTQLTNEAGWTGYSRIAVSRNSGAPAWTITGNVAHPNAIIDFGTASGGSETDTFMGIGTDATGAGHLEWYGALSPTIAVSNGVPVFLTTATAITGT
jgi:hypothetical protein